MKYGIYKIRKLKEKMNPNIELFLRNLISLNYIKSSIYSYYVSDLNEVYDTDGKKNK